MIWRTSNGRWLDRYGKWHLRFAWKPVSLEPPLDSAHAEPMTRAWWCVVWRIGVLVKGQRFWLYRPVEEEQPAARTQERPKLRIVK